MKILIKVEGEKGLYIFVGNDLPFVVAFVEDNNGIGKPVQAWWQGSYFHTLEEALTCLKI